MNVDIGISGIIPPAREKSAEEGKLQPTMFEALGVPEPFQRKFAEWRKRPLTKEGVPLVTFLKVARELGVEQPQVLLNHLVANGHAQKVGDNTKQFVQILG